MAERGDAINLAKVSPREGCTASHIRSGPPRATPEKECPMTPHTAIPTRLRRRLPAALVPGIAAGAIAIGVIIATAPAAQADVGQVEAQCHGLDGTWTHVEGTGYTCCYKSLTGSGKTQCDAYAEDGTFLGSQDDTAPTTKPTIRPLPSGIRPPGGNAGTLPGPTTTPAPTNGNPPGAGTLQ